jgi:hypothetical protein
MGVVYCIIAVIGFTVAGGMGALLVAKPGMHSGSTGEEERVVRAAIGDLFKVDPQSIIITRPLSDPPLRLEESHLAQLVAEIERRLGVQIPGDQVEELSRDQSGNKRIQISPADLVRLAVEAKEQHQARDWWVDWAEPIIVGIGIGSVTAGYSVFQLLFRRAPRK